MKYQISKKIVLSVLTLIAVLLLIGCGQQRAVKNEQMDGLENESINYLETEEEPSTTPEAAEQHIIDTPASEEPEQSTKAIQQQETPIQKSNNDMPASAKADNTPEKSDDKPSDSTEESKKTTIEPEKAPGSAPDSEQPLDRIRNSLQSLVNAGTITQEQAEMIVDAFPEEVVSGSGFRFTQDPFSPLVEQGVITQEQLDAVRDAFFALMSNRQGSIKR